MFRYCARPVALAATRHQQAQMLNIDIDILDLAHDAVRQRANLIAPVIDFLDPPASAYRV